MSERDFQDVAAYLNEERPITVYDAIKFRNDLTNAIEQCIYTRDEYRFFMRDISPKFARNPADAVSPDERLRTVKIVFQY